MTRRQDTPDAPERASGRPGSCPLCGRPSPCLCDHEEDAALRAVAPREEQADIIPFPLSARRRPGTRIAPDASPPAPDTPDDDGPSAA